MKKKYTSWELALKIWFFTSLLFALGLIMIVDKPEDYFGPLVFCIALITSLGGSVPVLAILLIAIPVIRKHLLNLRTKIFYLLFVEAACISVYGIIGAFMHLHPSGNLFSGLMTFGFLLSCALMATFICYQHIRSLFSGPGAVAIHDYSTSSLYSSKKYTTMETIPGETQSRSNKALIKGLVAGGLILLMLMPTLFIKDLISEREARQKEVVKEVSAKWGTAQTISGPFLVIPYTENTVNSEGKPVFVKKQLVVLSKNMNVNGRIIPENRPRSIYKVLLYKSNVDINGVFQPNWPVDINPATFDLANSRLCFGLTDFKGIEEEIYISFNKQRMALSPGLPENNITETGLSVPVAISLESLSAGIPYEMNVKLKGSERLHLKPLSANSSFVLTSSWPDPSFDGNTLPNERTVNYKGFVAKWNYNQANLPFGSVIKNGITIQDMSFGVSMVQPADQYNKTMRSVKYAILIIGLTFALFFIVELMQSKPFHPVQYVLVGMALVIFYTLLLAISEYLLFDHAYLIAAAATVILISLYARSHFNSWKTATVFGTVLSSLYGFIFILLRLEDTALLVGSIGLFIVLAVVMYVSRKVDWYGVKDLQPVTIKN